MCRYVNINYLGLHKILKKHDKNIPDMRVHAFYANWIHREKWLSGDYSEELVMLSDVFSKLRGDASGVKNEDAAQVRPLICLPPGAPRTSLWVWRDGLYVLFLAVANPAVLL